jgi:hypothetical protein
MNNSSPTISTSNLKTPYDLSFWNHQQLLRCTMYNIVSISSNLLLYKIFLNLGYRKERAQEVIPDE